MPRTSRKQREEQRAKNRLFPGPKMKPRPLDFDEELVRKAPTFLKWTALADGQSLTYACRTFTKGNGDDEERLMRRIMIARRNNLKDHAVLKRARALEAEKIKEEVDETSLTTAIMMEEPRKQSLSDEEETHHDQSSLIEFSSIEQQQATATYPSIISTNPSGTKRRYIPGKLRPSDHEILSEMDVSAVESTRSYRKWLSLADGETLSYNQDYIKGDPEQDWLLRKNIWRRMRYRRENAQKVKEMQREELQQHQLLDGESDVNELGTTMDEATSLQVQSVVDAAVAAAAAAHAESYADCFDAVAVAALDAGTVSRVGGDVGEENGGEGEEGIISALDAAAQLAASVLNPGGVGLDPEEEGHGEEVVHCV
ncbi:hypothetical protein ACHAWO_005392 [Cyclotella atomus]|uniref:Uncharacterized protein n=1 Tax=Cyclotella atomus TaxID=382360 RepID=A0ABD3N8H1_9STRA